MSITVNKIIIAHVICIIGYADLTSGCLSKT